MTAATGLRFHGDRLAGPGLIDFAANVLPQRPAVVEEALREALAEPGYPDDRAAREAIARRHGRQPDEVLPLNGACEGFWLLAQALRPRRALCVHPAFTEGEAALRAAGARVRRVVLRPDWKLPVDDPGGDAELVLLTNPNNPTGRLEPAAAVARLARPGRLLVVDESFMEFAADCESLAGRADLPTLVVLRSVTKLWSLAGVRAGYLLAQRALVERLEGQRQPWSVNALACAALRVCSEERDTARRLAAAVNRRREALAAALGALPGIRVWPSAANFLLLRVPDGPALAAGLRECGIAVRPAGTFPGLGPDFVRVAVRDEDENRALASAVAGVLGRA